MDAQVFFVLLLVLAKSNGQTRCLSNLSHLIVQWNETKPNFDPNNQLAEISSKLVNMTEESKFCSFQIILTYEERRLEVAFLNLNNNVSVEETIQTVFQLMSNYPGSTTFHGVCSTDMCDQKRFLVAARWMLFEGKSYYYIRSMLVDLLNRQISEQNSIQCFTMINKQVGVCNGAVCFANIQSENYSAKCFEIEMGLRVSLKTVAKFEQQQKSVIHNLRYV
jgi:hypothetical protein